MKLADESPNEGCRVGGFEVAFRFLCRALRVVEPLPIERAHDVTESSSNVAKLVVVNARGGAQGVGGGV